MRILVTGSRDWTDWERVHKALEDVWDEAGHDDLTVVHGACPTGADAIAERWATTTAYPYVNDPEPHPADWKKNGRQSAGFIRNAEMVALGADLCLAFLNPCAKRYCRKPKPHDSHGAAHCADYAEAHGIRVERFRPSQPPPA